LFLALREKSYLLERRNAGGSMKMTKDLAIKKSEPEKVDAYMAALKHPQKNVLESLRRIILSTDAEIGEEIKWNAPTFFYAGEMAPFNPKEYRRYLIVSNLFKKDCIRLVFPSGARIGDKSGLLTGDYADGRRLALFPTVEEVNRKEPALRKAIRKWLDTLDKY
jgi:hypothetical protein